jgi:hypothetical protein
MAQLDQVLQDAQQENPFLLPLLTVSLDGGRFFVMSSKAEELFAMMPEIFFYEKIDSENPQDLSRLAARDLLFIETEKVDELWSLGQATGCQLALVGDKKMDESLIDYYVTEKDLRSAVLSFGV